MGGRIAERLRKDLLAASEQHEMFAKCDANTAYNRSVVEYILQHNIQSLETLLIGDQQLKPGLQFYVETSMIFKGAGKAWEDIYFNRKKPSYFSFRFSFEAFDEWMFVGELNAEHLYSTSAPGALSGRTVKFLFGHVQAVEGRKVTLRSVIIGDRVLHDDASFAYQPPQKRLEVHDIDEFREIKNVRFKDPSLELSINKTIPESKLKQFIAEIIGEANVDKDWGGEQSDLFTTQIHVNGERLRAAFVLKGPSKFHKMQMKDLGKNGDQIARLFDEPADIFILQHCHDISSAVIKTMDAFANQINRPRKYCIINGRDTLRLLKAYGKLPQ